MAELSTSVTGRGLRWINGLGGWAPGVPPEARTIAGTLIHTPPPSPPGGRVPTAGLGLPGHRSPSAGFDAPFEMLGACHERVQRSLDLLARLVAHAEAHGPDAGARQAAADVERYFSLAAPHHHADEERHVLPRLADDPRPEVQAAVRRILDDHAAFRAIWQDLGPALAALRDGAPADMPRLARLARAFIDRHAEHLPLEDGLLFPAAAARLDEAALAAMGREMAQRRRAA